MTTETTETIMSAAPADLRTAFAFAEKLEAETELAKAASLRNHAVSGGIIVGAIGMSAAACLFAWGSRNPSPEELQMALAKLPPIEVAVTLDPEAKVALADGGKVTLADGGTVKIDPSSTIKVDVPPIQLPAAKGPEKTEDGDIIKREVTVFYSVELSSNRSVVTGWKYPNGAATQPTGAYCYVSEDNPGSVSKRVDIAVDGITLTSARSLVPDFDQLLGKCVWWSGGKA